MKMKEICEKIEFEGAVESVQPLGEGLINDTYIVRTKGNAPDYILQRKNGNIFKDIPAMMQNIWKVTTHLKSKVEDPMREALTVIKTRDGELCYRDAHGEYWAACYLIPDAVTCQRADSPRLAECGGVGIGRFQAQLSDMTEPLADILPGFHNMRFRLEQWDATIARDAAGRVSSVAREIEWIESRRGEMLAFWERFERGDFPVRVTHNDTKISNILFDKRGEVLCVIDLDTVLNSMCLNDYGDAIRSYANTGLEDDPNLDNVRLDMSIFEAYTRGYLSQAGAFLTEAERSGVAFSARYITFEQVLRFLMDYIDGDKYYKVRDPRHNLLRTRAQYKLLQEMEANFSRMSDVVDAG